MTISQLAAFSLSFMLLALLLVLRGDLLERWQQQLPPDSPNYFLLNMTEAQVPQVKTFLQQHQIKPETYYPIVRVRLTEINQQLATERVHEDDPGGEAVNRELNLTWLADLPDHNPLVAGSWPPKSGEVSMDEGIAGRLKITLGDTLTFSGDTGVQRQGHQPAPGGLGKPEAELLLYLPAGRWTASRRLAYQLPLRRRRPDADPAQPPVSDAQPAGHRRDPETGRRRAAAGQPRAGGDGGAGGAVRRLTAAGAGAGRHASAPPELVVYRTLGAGKRLLRRTLWCEFALLGLVAGIAAAVGAEAALWLLQSRVFDFPWTPTPVLWWALPLASALLLSLCGGWLGVRLLRGRALFRSYEG